MKKSLGLCFLLLSLSGYAAVPTTSVSVTRPTTDVKVERPTTGSVSNHPQTTVTVERPTTPGGAFSGEQRSNPDGKGAKSADNKGGKPTGNAPAQEAQKDPAKEPQKAAKLVEGEKGLGQQSKEQEAARDAAVASDAVAKAAVQAKKDLATGDIEKATANVKGLDERLKKILGK